MENRGVGGKRSKEGSFKRASIKRTSSGSQKVRDVFFDYPNPAIYYVHLKWKRDVCFKLFLLMKLGDSFLMSCVLFLGVVNAWI